VAIDDATHTKLNQTINILFPLSRPIKVQNDIFGLMRGRVRLSNIYGQPLIDITSCAISEGDRNLKRLGDIIFSIIALILVSPVIGVLAILIKLDSKGPVFFRQERIGYHRKPFTLYKLRTMRVDAEGDGTTRLSRPNDDRITPLGRFMRKYRFDELPQFWNILKGDMSLVGPRPEREYFIKQIMAKAPYYALMFQIRPGLTSWGMVKFGYACNVDEMIERLQYDVLYLENMSILVDIKIIIYTVRTVLLGRGM
jgi:exopolysaccharide biosynthesis polyprenyl glycosylphosphotransferase